MGRMGVTRVFYGINRESTAHKPALSLSFNPVGLIVINLSLIYVNKPLMFPAKWRM